MLKGRGDASWGLEATLRAALCGLLALVAPAGGALAGPDDWTEGYFSKARMAAAGTDGSGARWVVIEVALEPGWKTYWRWPGVSGLPPRLAWSGAAEPAVVWPTPARLEIGGVTSYGYGERLALAAVWPAGAHAPAQAELTLDIGVCSEICAPERFELSASPGAEDGAPAWATTLLRQVIGSAPEKARAVGVEIARCETRRTDVGGAVEIEATLPEAYRDAETLAAPPSGAGLGDVRVERGAGGAVTVAADILSDRAAPREPSLTLLLLRPDGAGAVYEACVD